MREVKTKDESEVSVISEPQRCLCQEEGFRGQRRNLPPPVPSKCRHGVGRLFSESHILHICGAFISPPQSKFKHSCLSKSPDLHVSLCGKQSIFLLPFTHIFALVFFLFLQAVWESIFLLLQRERVRDVFFYLVSYGFSNSFFNV